MRARRVRCAARMSARVSLRRAFRHNHCIISQCWMRHAQMQAYVYKSLRKADTYVYLAARDAFQTIPEPLRLPLGGLAFVLEVALTPERTLARADVAQVRQNLLAHGFHLQVPPSQAELPVAFGGQVHG